MSTIYCIIITFYISVACYLFFLRSHVPFLRSCDEALGWKDTLIWKHRRASSLTAPALTSLISKTHIVPDIYCNAPHLNFLPSICWLFEGEEWNTNTNVCRQWRKLGMPSAWEAKQPWRWCLTWCAHCRVPTRLLRLSSLLVDHWRT